MNAPFFNQKEAPPDEPKIKKALGELYATYKEILELTEAFNHEWKYYGGKIGWQFKAIRKGKSLFWLTPLEQSFKIAFAVKEDEKEVLLHSKLSAAATEELKAAKKYPEGYPLRLEVRKKTDMKTVRRVLKALTELRT